MLHCHNSGFIHHDLKLENILVELNNQGVIDSIKITDFGLTKKTSDMLLDVTHFQGSIGYAAPEMFIAGKPLNQLIDSWSLGIILVELLSGKNPFEAISVYDTKQNILNQEISFEGSLWSGISIEAKDLIDQLL